MVIEAVGILGVLVLPRSLGVLVLLEVYQVLYKMYAVLCVVFLSSTSNFRIDPTAPISNAHYLY